MGLLENMLGQKTQNSQSADTEARLGSLKSKYHSVVAAPPSERVTPVQTYIVRAGDTLSKIALHFYGDAKASPRIFEANRNVIKNPDLIHPGEVLKIPGGSKHSV